MVIRVVNLVFSHSIRISKNKYRVLFKKIPMTLKSRKKMIMRKNYYLEKLK